MAFFDDFRTQPAVYWPRLSGSDRQGRPRLGTPVEILVRWDGSGEMFVDKEGRSVVSSAEVMVPEGCEEGGALRLGALSTLTDTQNPWGNSKVYEIKKMETTPTPDGSETLYVAMV